MLIVFFGVLYDSGLLGDLQLSIKIYGFVQVLHVSASETLGQALESYLLQVSGLYSSFW